MIDVDELKREMNMYIMNREGIPDNNMRIMKEGFERIIQLYEDLHCMNSSIQEYVYGKIEEVKGYSRKIVGEKRQEEQGYQLMAILNRFERRMEEEKTEEEKERQKEVSKEELAEVKGENIVYTGRIIEILEEELKDVQSRQNNILDARGYSSERIDQIRQEALFCIRQFIGRNEELINDNFTQDDKQVQNKLIDIFESYLINNKESKEESFRNSLDANISLEEQKEFAVKRAKEQKDLETPGNALPDKIIY